MADVITTTEGGLEEGERRAERDLGAVIAQVEHLVKTIEEHTTTIEGLREDRNWITHRFEAIERTIAELPTTIPDELRTQLNAIAELTSRIEHLEAATTHEEETKPPHRDENHRSEEGESHEHRHHERRSLLDHLF